MNRIIVFYRVKGKYGFLSNLFKRKVLFEGRVFETAEHAYQFAKPKENKVREWIDKAPEPHLVATTAHALLGFDIAENWNEIKLERMKNVLRAKFSQHNDLKAKLLETGDNILMENSETDSFWGIGKKGNGKNMLGRLLMQIRKELGDIPNENK